MASRVGLRLILILVVVLITVQVAFRPVVFEGGVPSLRRPVLRMSLGLDLQGGSLLVLEGRDAATVKATPQAVDDAMRIIAQRVDQLGVVESSLQRQGTNRMIVELPGIADPDHAIRLIGKTALLEFVDTGAQQLPHGARWTADNTRVSPPGPPEPESAQARATLRLEKKVILTGADLESAQAAFDQATGEPIVQFKFRSRAAKTFEEFTRANIGRHLTIVLDNEVITSPVIRSEIAGGSGQISGGFAGIGEARDIAVLLRGGALPIPIEVVERRTVGPQLGRDSIDASLRAGMLAVTAVILFMLLYYGLPGALADLALGVYVIMLLALMSGLGATLTLPGIAGLVLSIGMAVDANVVIYERIKDELRAGKNMRSAIGAGWNRAMNAVLDSNITTLIAGAVLLLLGTGAIRGFAVILSLGVLASMFSAVVVTRALIDGVISVGLGQWVSRIAGTVSSTTVSSSARLWDVIGSRKWGYVLSALLVVPGAAALILNASAGQGALNWGIDFTGGDLYHLRLERPFTVGQVRDTVDRFAPGESIIQKSDQEVFIRTRPLADEARPGFLRALGNEFGSITLLRAEEVGPKIGRELRNAAVLAVLVGLALQVAYITYRFKSIRFALTSNAALLHDLLVVTGIFALTRMEVNSSFVAVLLTVVGYSINDTIIVYDRIRENLAKGTREPFERLVNRSIVETLVRSLTTGMAAIMAITAVYLFGGSTTRDFAFGLLAGIVAGTYSSIFNASALLVDWHSWSGRRGGRPRESVVMP